MESIIALSQEDELMLIDLFKAITKKKSEIFKLRKKDLEHIVKVTVGTSGIAEEIKFYQDELEKEKKKVFEGPDATRVVDKLTRKKFREVEFFNQARIGYIKDQYLEPKWREIFVSSLAGRYLSPHMLEYLIDRITTLKNKQLSTSINAATEQKQANTGKRQASKTKELSNRITLLIWEREKNDVDGKKRDKKLSQLHYLLRKNHYIAPIALSTFKKHFSGRTQGTLINWTANQFQLVYLLDKLNTYLSPSFYKHKNPSTTTISKHFLHKGNPINENSLRVAFTKKEAYFEKNFQSDIDLIINNLNIV